jgi:hypothetical protein
VTGTRTETGWRLANEFQPVYWIKRRDRERYTTTTFEAREIGNGEVEITMEVVRDNRHGTRRVKLRLTPEEVVSLVRLATGPVSQP